MDAAGDDPARAHPERGEDPVRDARQERFDFLGYTFGPHHYRKDGHWYLGASPSKKSVQRLRSRSATSWSPPITRPGTRCAIA